MDSTLQEIQGLRVAVEGCGHGTLDAIYTSIDKACEARNWDGIDLLIIGGDFQAVRNASDLTVMSCPVKYREIGDFHKYYSGISKAPYLTIFVGGNHEASSHLWELYYGGWVAPNIYYMGAANVVQVGGVRIAGMSGIWKGYNYNTSHHERLPYNQDDIKSIYHVREVDIRKLLQIRTQVDVGISHDWPRAIEKNGNERALFNMKPDFEQESKDGTLGNQAATYVMDRLRPPYWFSAHMHCKFAATKTYDDASETTPVAVPMDTNGQRKESPGGLAVIHNTDEIDLDMDDDDDETSGGVHIGTNGSSASTNHVETNLEDEAGMYPPSGPVSSVPDALRAQLPAAFTRPSQRLAPGQPTPSDVTNKTVRFLALDKCLPGRKFLQLLEILPHSKPYEVSISIKSANSRPKPKFEYDPEWLAITRVFNCDLVLGDKTAKNPQDLGEAHYRPLIDKEREWVNENVTKKGKLEIPENFTLTAPPFFIGMPEIINEGPVEYNNPQMQQFCELVGIENKFFATDEEREQRIKNGPGLVESHRGGFGRRGRGGRGGRGPGRGRSRGRGRGW